MYQYKCMNQIAQFGLDHFTRDYAQTENIEEADALLVRSAALHDMEFPENLKTIARAGAGVNNIPLGKCAEQGIVVFNTPGANANGVKELDAKFVKEAGRFPSWRKSRKSSLRAMRSWERSWESSALEPSA